MVAPCVPYGSLGRGTIVAMQTEATYRTLDAEQTKALAASLAPLLQPDDVILLTGGLGAGKTQFAQGVAAGLGIQAQVISPTFNILLVYEGGRLPLFHFDLYRLDAAEDLEDIAFYDTLENGGVTLIEWGDTFRDEMPDDYVEITLEPQGDERDIHVQANGPRSAELLAAWVAAREACNG